MAIEKDSSEWVMMKDLYSLYSLSLNTITRKNMSVFSNALSEFNKKHNTVPAAKELSKGLEEFYYKRTKGCENGNTVK